MFLHVKMSKTTILEKWQENGAELSAPSRWKIANRSKLHRRGI